MPSLKSANRHLRIAVLTERASSFLTAHQHIYAI